MRLIHEGAARGIYNLNRVVTHCSGLTGLENKNGLSYGEHRRRNQGGRGGHGPPRFQNTCFCPPPPPPPPPQISKPEINQHWLEITIKHVLQFLKCNLHEIFLLEGLCIHSYMEIKELIRNPRLPISFLAPPGCNMFLRLWRE